MVNNLKMSELTVFFQKKLTRFQKSKFKFSNLTLSIPLIGNLIWLEVSDIKSLVFLSTASHSASYLNSYGACVFVGISTSCKKSRWGKALSRARNRVNRFGFKFSCCSKSWASSSFTLSWSTTATHFTCKWAANQYWGLTWYNNSACAGLNFNDNF